MSGALENQHVAAVVALAQAGIPTDVQMLLVYGDPLRGIAPGALARAVAAQTPPPSSNVEEMISGFEAAYPELHWSVGKGKLSPTEPMYGAIIETAGGTEIGHGECDTSAAAALRIAIQNAGLTTPPPPAQNTQLQVTNPSTIAQFVGTFSEHGVKLPLRATDDDIGTLVDDDGKVVLVVDVERERSDEDVAWIVGMIQVAVNTCGGFKAQRTTVAEGSTDA